MMKNQNKSTIKRTHWSAYMVLAAAFLFSTAMVQAQQTTGDVTKQTEIDYGTTTTGGAIKVIDNKGTIKYLQTANGLTTLTNTTADVTTTTIQLGGTLTTDSFVDVDGNVFGFNGIGLVDTATESASTDATDESDAGTGTGYTLLVRDEATGAVKKMKLTDLPIVGGQEPFTATAGQTAYPVAGATALTAYKTYVYRNGAKLVAGTDYTVATNVVTLTLTNHSVFAGDVIEVHYLN
jgi:hypothetical protein